MPPICCVNASANCALASAATATSSTARPFPTKRPTSRAWSRRFNQAVCTLLRCSPEQMMGRLAWDFMSPERQEEAREAMTRRIQEGKEAGPFECEYVLDDGSHLTVEIRENLIRNDRGEVTGIDPLAAGCHGAQPGRRGRPQGASSTPWSCATRTSSWRAPWRPHAPPPWPRAAFWPASPTNCAPR